MFLYIVDGYAPQQDDGSEQHVVTIGVFNDHDLASQARKIAEENGYSEVLIKPLELNKFGI
jgi:hypothetical protein